jgi:hypothetical protein
MKTMGEARREAGIKENEYIYPGDSIDRIATIRCLARKLGPPDHRFNHLNCCSLVWGRHTGAILPCTIVVLENGSITS